MDDGPDTLRLLHTSDWHLGHTLNEYERDREHAAFLAWLLDTIEAERIDALLIAGDVFETSSPSAKALEQWFRFLGTCSRRFPDLDVIAIGGNHDSAARLDAPNALLEGSRLRVVGGYAGRDKADFVFPIARGDLRAWVCAVPFLRPADLPDVSAEDPLIEGVRRVYEGIFDAARAVRGEGEPIIAMGHLYMVGGEISALSERKVLGGNQHALPATIFPNDVAYVALGHLHKAQSVGGSPHVRYAGSPLPLSTTEASYTHQVLSVRIAHNGAAHVTPHHVPRTADIVRIPTMGAASPAEVLSLLAALPDKDSIEPWRAPFVEIHVALVAPEPGFVGAVHDALASRAARLVRIERVRGGTGASLATAEPERTLRELTPEQVFLRLWARKHDAAPSAELLEAFHETVDAVGQGEP